MQMIRFLATAQGRVFRVLIGVALILAGAFVFWERGGIVLVVVGLLPLLAGINDVCLLAPFFNLPMIGEDIRAHFGGESRRARQH